MARGPMLALVAVFLVLGIWATAQEMPSAASGGSMAFRIGVGVVPGVGVVLNLLRAFGPGGAVPVADVNHGRVAVVALR